MSDNQNKDELKWLNEEPKYGLTHAGQFHSDDVFATAFLKILFPKIKITRAFSVPEDFDGIVYDIGFGRYDHHQADKEIRENGVPYAAFGLLWRDFGSRVVSEREAKKFDKNFVQPLDESDNTGNYCAMAEVMANFNPSWDSEIPTESRFWDAVSIAKRFLANYIERYNSSKRADSLVEEAMNKGDGTTLVLERHLPWKRKVCKSTYKSVIYPSNRGGYSIQIVPIAYDDNTLSANFPEEWRGKTPEELASLSGIDGLRFCHASGFLAVAETLEDALKVAALVK